MLQALHWHSVHEQHVARSLPTLLCFFLRVTGGRVKEIDVYPGKRIPARSMVNGRMQTEYDQMRQLQTVRGLVHMYIPTSRTSPPHHFGQHPLPRNVERPLILVVRCSRNCRMLRVRRFFRSALFHHSRRKKVSFRTPITVSCESAAGSPQSWWTQLQRYPTKLHDDTQLTPKTIPS